MTTRTTPTPDSPTLAEMMEHLGWVHHVGDAATGELLTTQLDRPIAPLSRAERLFRLGHQFDPSIFGSPTHRLTPLRPHQASPLGFLRFTWAREVWALGDLNEGHAIWNVAEDIVGERVGRLQAILFDPPQGRCLLALYFFIINLPGTVGRVRIEVNGPSGEEIASFGVAVHGDGLLSHTFDLVFVPVQAPIPTHWVRMDLAAGSGLHSVLFEALTLAPLRPDIMSGGPNRA